MLIPQLRELESAGVFAGKAYPVVPPQVEYPLAKVASTATLGSVAEGRLSQEESSALSRHLPLLRLPSRSLPPTFLARNVSLQGSRLDYSILGGEFSPTYFHPR